MVKVKYNQNIWLMSLKKSCQEKLNNTCLFYIQECEMFFLFLLRMLSFWSDFRGQISVNHNSDSMVFRLRDRPSELRIVLYKVAQYYAQAR